MTNTPSDDQVSPESDDGEEKPRRGVSLLVLLPLIIFLCLALLFLFQLSSGEDPSIVPSALIGKEAPQLDIPAVAGLIKDGQPMPGIAKDTLIGTVSVVNVFASWCVPCRQEHPILEEFARAKPKGVQFVGINYKDKAENARRFLGMLGNPYERIGADEKGQAGIEWGVYGVPETYVVDRKGVIRFKFVGPFSEDTYRKQLMPQVLKALAE